MTEDICGGEMGNGLGVDNQCQSCGYRVFGRIVPHGSLHLGKRLSTGRHMNPWFVPIVITGTDHWGKERVDVIPHPLPEQFFWLGAEAETLGDRIMRAFVSGGIAL